MKIKPYVLSIMLFVGTCQRVMGVSDDVKDTAVVFLGTTALASVYTFSHFRASQFFKKRRKNAVAYPQKAKVASQVIYVLSRSIPVGCAITAAARFGEEPHTCFKNVITPLCCTSLVMGTASYYMKDNLTTANVYSMAVLVTMGVAGYTLYKRY